RVAVCFPSALFFFGLRRISSSEAGHRGLELQAATRLELHRHVHTVDHGETELADPLLIRGHLGDFALHRLLHFGLVELVSPLRSSAAPRAKLATTRPGPIILMTFMLAISVNAGADLGLPTR